MVDHPKKPFTLATRHIRDKDNAAPEPKPPRWAQYPRLNIAPSGALGIKRNMPAPKTARADKEPRKLNLAFRDKAREFKPIVSKSRDKDHGHER